MSSFHVTIPSTERAPQARYYREIGEDKISVVVLDFGGGNSAHLSIPEARNLFNELGAVVLLIAENEARLLELAAAAAVAEVATL